MVDERDEYICACEAGYETGGREHESWCPAVGRRSPDDEPVLWDEDEEAV